MKVEVYVKDLLGYLSEALENGYNIDYTLDQAKRIFDLDDFQLIAIKIIMEGFNYNKDSNYKKFNKDILKALDL